MQTYIEYAKGSCSNRANTTPLFTLPTIVAECIKDKKELYRSYYEYDEDMVEYVSQRHTVRDFPGKYYCNRILFDIDFKKDGEICREEALDVAEALELKYEIPRDAIKIAFSGRGFHISIPNYFNLEPSNTLPQDIRTVLKQYLPDIMKIADNIFDGARLIRVTNTINTKSNLYKIPLSWMELEEMSYKDITEKAKEPRYDYTSNTETPKTFYPEIWGTFQLKAPPPKKEPIAAQEDFNAANVVTCMQKVYNMGSEASAGQRHLTTLRLASAWRRAGLPMQATIAAIQSWWDNKDVPRLVTDTYEKRYSPGCSDFIMKKHCVPNCVYFKNKDYTADAMSVEQQEEQLVKRITTDFSKTSFDIADMYSINGKYTFYPGELVTILGDTGLGKTAFVQNLCVHTKLNVLYLSLEMSDWLMYRRFCQIAANESSEQVKDNLRNGYEKGSKTDYQKLLTWNKERTLNIMTSRPDITNIRNIVATHKPHILVIDHIGFLKSNIHDPRAKTNFITGFLKDIAIQQECIVLAVSHIRRPSDGEALNIHMGKESSSIEQDSDKVIGIEGEQNSSIRTIKSLKSRDEGFFSMDFDVDFNTFRFMQT